MPWAARAPPARLHRRVVVTGVGLVPPLGVGAALSWARLCAGDGFGADLLGGFPLARVPRGAAPGAWDAARHVPRADARSMSPDVIAFALAAAGEALADAALLPARARAAAALADVPGGAAVGDDGRVGPYAPERVGVAVGAGVGPVEEVGAAAVALARGERPSPFFVPRILLNMAAGSVAMRFGLRGPNSAPATACASGAHAIGEALRAVQSGAADAMVAGGTEAALGPIAVAGFARARALAGAAGGCRPFDARRDGFVLGEGAAALVLEAADAAAARGARVYAEVRGFGASGDAFHITSPRADGAGAAAAMRAALADGGLAPADVGYVNAHATGTGAGDAAEAAAVAAVWRGARAGAVAVASSKGNVGHLLGAAGAAEAVFTVLALARRALPATRGLRDVDAAVAALCAPAGGPLRLLGADGDARAADGAGVRAALSNSFGFGGTNASLLFARME